jgi:D-amino-acid oxidase
MANRRNAVVVGSGVVGLTSAIRLQEAGWSVLVVGDRPVTSYVAAAVWFPTLAAPRENVVRWGRDTNVELVEEARAGVPGVILRDSVTLYREPPGRPWWTESIDDVRPAPPELLPAGYGYGLRFTAPLVEMHRYVPWLEERIRERGGVLEQGRVASLAEAGRGADLVVHCTGLGARELVGDLSVTPVRGQVVRVVNPGLTLSVRDENHPGGRAYVHPRTDDCILGGTFEEGRWDTTPDADVAEAIIERCLDLVPELRGVEVLEHLAGLRPVRPTVRLEAEPPTGDMPRVIHNYGHGGSGVTLAWGCADDVAALAGSGDPRST